MDHRGKRYNVESLVNTVMQTWKTGKLDDTITKVHDRLKIVPSLIVEGNGANDFVETKRGVKWRNTTLPMNLEPITNNTNNTNSNWTNLLTADLDENENVEANFSDAEI